MNTMATSSDFFAEDKLHGHVKRIILKKFLQAFVPVSYYRTVKYGKKIDGFVIIDGFAGEGKYGAEWPLEIDQYGSPLISLMVTLNFLYRQEHHHDIVWNIGEETLRSEMKFQEIVADILNPISISGYTGTMASFFFVEDDWQRFDKLVENVATIFNFYNEPCTRYSVSQLGRRGFIFTATYISCTIMKCSFAEFSESFHEGSLHRRACFTFLDPFGFSQTPMNLIQKFVGDDKTILINFMSGYVNRFISIYPEHVAKLYGFVLPEMQYAMMDAVSKQSFVNSLMEKVRRSPPGYLSTSGNIQKCAINFQMALQLQRVSWQDLSLMFEMRGAGNVPIYHLVFLAGHPKTYGDMKEAMNICTQYELEMKLSDYDIIRKGHILKLSNMQDNTKVANVIFERFTGRQVNIEEIKWFILYETPFVFRKEALSIMESEGFPRITDVADLAGRIRARRYTYPDGTNWIITFRCAFVTVADIETALTDLHM